MKKNEKDEEQERGKLNENKQRSIKEMEDYPDNKNEANKKVIKDKKEETKDQGQRTRRVS